MSPIVCVRLPKQPGFIAAVAFIAAVGCEERVQRYPIVDRPMPTPHPVADTSSSSAAPALADASADEPQACTRGTGRNAAGQCVELRTRDVGYVQRVQIPGGRVSVGDFPLMYAVADEPAGVLRWPEQPPRTIERAAFWIDLHEVTRNAYEACTAAGDCTPASCAGAAGSLPTVLDPRAPQTCVTWSQARAFCRHHGGRLPEDYEWEIAARGLDRRLWPWGNRIRDEYTADLLPVGSRDDVSYFGIRGMGSNALEWTEPSPPLEPIATFVQGGFRRSKAPTDTLRGLAVVRGGRTSARRLTPKDSASPTIGFRCAADIGSGDVALTLPDPPQEVDLVAETPHQRLVFLGVAESIERAEAIRFCRALTVEMGERTLGGWRLPTLEEIHEYPDLFRGPGPFWTRAGAAVTRSQPGSRPRPDDPFVEYAARPKQRLAARCIRDSVVDDEDQP